MKVDVEIVIFERLTLQIHDVQHNKSRMERPSKVVEEVEVREEFLFHLLPPLRSMELSAPRAIGKVRIVQRTETTSHTPGTGFRRRKVTRGACAGHANPASFQATSQRT